MMISALLSSTVELSHLTNRYTAFYLSHSPISFAPTFNPIPHNTTIKLLTTRSSSFFSQGPGNFRDVNQNRRNDVMIHPAVGDFNIRMFLSFVQADGYNPLQVATTNFKVPADKVDALVLELGILESYDANESVGKGVSNADTMKKLLQKPFRIGQLFKDMKSADISFRAEKNVFLTKVMVAADQASAAAYMQNGYWCDVSL
jgi:hypothetical protein